MNQLEFEVHHVIGLRTDAFQGWRKGLSRRPCGQCGTMTVLNEAARDMLRQRRPKPQILCHVCAWENTPPDKDGAREFYHATLVEREL